MAVMQMRKVCICALKKERKPVLEKIQQFGMMEINESVGEEEGFSRMDVSVARAAFERNAAIAENALQILGEYCPEKKGMFSSLEGKKCLDKSNFDRIVEQKDDIISQANRIIQLQKDVQSVKADCVKLNGQLDAVIPWLNMDVPAMTTGTLRTSFLYGSIPESLTQEQLYEKIQQNGNFPEAGDVRVFYSDKNQTCVAAFCMKKDRDSFEEALRSIGFSKPSLVMRSVPQKSREKWLARLKEYSDTIEATKNEITDMAQCRENLQVISDYFRMRAEKYKILGTLNQSKHAFFITGYIPAEVEEKFRECLTKQFTILIETEKVNEDEEAPVVLKNNGFAAPVESIVESFGLPKKGEIDPSAIMAFFYYMLFGIMLSDAAYGFIIFIACFILIKKFPKMEESLNKSLHMFMYCGISTMIWGVLFGGYFGDIVTVVASSFFGKTIVIKPLWFAPIDDPMKLLLYSMGIGIIHMFLGLGIKAYMLLKEKRVKDCICDVVFWYMFLIGLILMLIPTDIFASLAQTIVVFPAWLKLLSKVLTIAGALGIVLMSGRRKKNNWPLRLALGAYDLYNVTGWLSDILSYSRLLALGLATGVIASVVNLMGSMFGTGVLGTILFIVVFIVGHTLNIAINVLGAYVHTNRLQYVEFFGKFYEGGGKPFNPFKINTKYIQIKRV